VGGARLYPAIEDVVKNRGDLSARGEEGGEGGGSCLLLRLNFGVARICQSLVHEGERLGVQGGGGGVTGFLVRSWGSTIEELFGGRLLPIESPPSDMGRSRRRSRNNKDN